jgi:hypothetical protein
MHADHRRRDGLGVPQPFAHLMCGHSAAARSIPPPPEVRGPSSDATALTCLSRRFNLSSEELGLLFSAFFWLYSLLQVPGGFVLDRFG